MSRIETIYVIIATVLAVASVFVLVAEQHETQSRDDFMLLQQRALNLYQDILRFAYDSQTNDRLTVTVEPNTQVSSNGIYSTNPETGEQEIIAMQLFVQGTSCVGENEIVRLTEGIAICCGQCDDDVRLQFPNDVMCSPRQDVWLPCSSYIPGNLGRVSLACDEIGGSSVQLYNDDGELLASSDSIVAQWDEYLLFSLQTPVSVGDYSLVSVCNGQTQTHTMRVRQPSSGGGGGGSGSRATNQTTPIIPGQFSFSILFPAPQTTLSYSPFMLQLSVYDPNAELNNCWYTLDGAPRVTIPSCSLMSVAAGPGNHIIRVFANTTSGTVYEQSSDFSVNLSIPLTCGNGLLDAGEVCDGNQRSCTENAMAGFQTCSVSCQSYSVCQLYTTCGDGIVGPLEQCDDGNVYENDGCSATCTTIDTCNDAIDNDGDGAVDEYDYACEQGMGSEFGETFPATTPCNDGIDNDGDGLVDWQYDLGCWGPHDDDEEAGSLEQEYGWSTFDKNPSDRIIYVSSSTGNDANDGFSPQTAVRTAAQGYALLRDYSGDWLLFKRGDSWNEKAGGAWWWDKNGLSPERKIVVSAYGQGDQRPIFYGTPTDCGFNTYGDDNFVFKGLEIYNHYRDIRSPAFTSVRACGNGFTLQYDTENITFEDNVLKFGPFQVQSICDPNCGLFKNVTISRNKVLYNTPSGGHSQGTYSSGAGMIYFRQNVYDLNGGTDWWRYACEMGTTLTDYQKVRDGKLFIKVPKVVSSSGNVVVKVNITNLDLSSVSSMEDVRQAIQQQIDAQTQTSGVLSVIFKGRNIIINSTNPPSDGYEIFGDQGFDEVALSAGNGQTHYCLDTDNGIHPFVKGSVRINHEDSIRVYQEDSCISDDTAVREYSCTQLNWGTNNWVLQSTETSCANGCSEGACITAGTTLSVCGDTLDNDGDGVIDLNDPGCTSLTDTSESEATTQCQDGIDNDGDGLVDVAQDGGCRSASDNNEQIAWLNVPMFFDQELCGNGQPTLYNRNFYLSANKVNLSLNDNIDSRGASGGLQMRMGGYAHNNFIYEAPVALTFGHDQNAPGPVYGNITYNVILGSADITVNVPRGFGISISNGSFIDRNIVANNVKGSSPLAAFFNGGAGTGNTGSYGGANATILQTTVSNNIAYDWITSRWATAPPSSGLGASVTIWGNGPGVATYPSEVQDLLFINNHFIQPRGGQIVSARNPTKTENSSWINNTMYSTFASDRWFNWMENCGASCSIAFNEWRTQVEHESGTRFVLPGYRNPRRNVSTYLATLGITGDISTFIDRAVQNSPASWDVRFTANAINDYIRDGFSITTPNYAPVGFIVATPTYPQLNTQVLFDPSQSYDLDGYITSYSWDFESDGTIDTTKGTAQIVGHTFTQGTNATVTLVVTDNHGNTHTSTITIIFNGENTLTGECSDGIDNDGDSWTDSLDQDCASGSTESWFALTRCSDGIDNDRDGDVDADDGQCSGATDDNEADFATNAQCSNGIDDDNNGLIDWPVDPGCINAQDNGEDSSNLGSAIQFAFSHGSDGSAIFRSLNATVGGVQKTIALDEYGRFGWAWNRFHPYSLEWGSSSSESWKYAYAGQSYTRTHPEITYQLRQVSPTLMEVNATDGLLQVNGTWRAIGDTLYVITTVKNIAAQDITSIKFPTYFGGFLIGNYSVLETNSGPAFYKMDPQASGVNNFGGFYAGYDAKNVRYSRIATSYPEINSYAPVFAVGDNNFTVGFQALMYIRPPEQINIHTWPFASHSPGFKAEYHLSLKPGQTKTLIYAVKIAPNWDWQAAFLPYKEYFNSILGSSTPRYCPTGPLSYNVGTNNNAYNRIGQGNLALPQRYNPGTQIRTILQTDQTLDTLDGMNFYGTGTWATGVHSCMLVNGADCAVEDIPACAAANNSGNCEFSAHVDLLDPHIDAARNPSILQSLAQTYGARNIDLFWYVRPCATVYGANLSYDTNGNPVFTRGNPSGYADVDLRNITNRDRALRVLDNVASWGVRGFYADAGGCPGENEFLVYAKQYMEDKYGDTFFVGQEGGRDVGSLLVAQFPLIKLPTYFNDSALLVDYLTPDATVYGGVFNAPLFYNETEDILFNKNFQYITQGVYPVNQLNEYCSSGSLWWEELCRNLTGPYTRGVSACRLINQSYVNLYENYDSYGRDMGCPAVPSSPPPCLSQ